MTQVLESARTTLRHWQDEDLPVLEALFCDPRVTAHVTPGGEPFAKDEIPRFLRHFGEHLAEYGFAPMAVVLKSSLEVIGVAGLKMLPKLGYTDLGFAYLEKSWGKGIATEVAEKVLESGFKELGLAKITALCSPANLASVRVLEKLGMRFEGQKMHLGTLNDLYAIERASFRR